MIFASKSMKLPIGLTALLALFVTKTTGYPDYQSYIPNGANVPSPCQSGTVWSGVGHKVPGGGGDRNPFGLDFDAQKHNWTQVCRLDSDGDGKTNGQELGDPNCAWTKGMTSPSAVSITHPGICEPMSSATCMSKNSWLTCPSQFNCPAINQPGVLSTVLRLPPTPVPRDETTYLRYGFRLPNDADYHLIASTPIINTSQILHHMILYGCTDGFTNYTKYSQPQPSGIMTEDNCTSMIALWGVGDTGNCLNSAFGISIGTRGFKYALLELHWNNPTHSASYVDSSGLTIYYTSTLRPNSGGVVMSGQVALNIEPGLASTSFIGGCSGYCTSALPKPLYIADVFLHMHLLGDAGSVKLFRNGVLRQTLLDAPTYDYNTPVSVKFDTPIEFRAGDSIVVNCTYDSTGYNSTVTYGESTSSEMCFAFMSYYPVNPQFQICTKWGVNDDCIGSSRYLCNTYEFYALADRVASVCNTSTTCSPDCKNWIQTIVNTGCITGDNLMWISYYNPQTAQLLPRFISSCGVPNPPVTTTSPRPNSATMFSLKMTLILNTALPALSFVLTLILTTCSITTKLSINTAHSTM